MSAATQKLTAERWVGASRGDLCACAHTRGGEKAMEVVALTTRPASASSRMRLHAHCRGRLKKRRARERARMHQGGARAADSARVCNRDTNARLPRGLQGHLGYDGSVRAEATPSPQ
jgi:hypothetical protein